MENRLKENINKIVDEVVSSRISNQQVTLTFNLDDPDAERRLKMMLSVDNYYATLHDFSQFLRNVLKYGNDEKVRFKSFDDYKEIVPDYNTMEYIREMFYEFLNKNRVDLND